eukprot:c16247_g1_i4.p1 GENE.c16247_g1_i4~~c16247_g1_i4.p1  ORF type:complete len:229 (+),score=24.63 c16247_g1_i4:1-687(+)
MGNVRFFLGHLGTMHGTKTHVKALQPHPQYPSRSHVPQDKIPWSVTWPDYKPTNYTADVVRKANRLTVVGGWADPEFEDLEPTELRRRITYCDRIRLDQSGCPLNPIGRTGMRGRGLLGKWGPNHAADPIVTRMNPITNSLEMVAIQRTDTFEWAIPGGMVDAGEQVSQTLKREFGEEAMSSTGMTPHELEEWKVQLDHLFHSGEEVFKGSEPAFVELDRLLIGGAAP